MVRRKNVRIWCLLVTSSPVGAMVKGREGESGLLWDESCSRLRRKRLSSREERWVVESTVTAEDEEIGRAREEAAAGAGEGSSGWEGGISRGEESNEKAGETRGEDTVEVGFSPGRSSLRTSDG